MRLLRWLSAGVVAFVLVGAFPVVAQGIPDEATRARVADRLDECVDMWRQLVPMGAYASEYSGTQGMRKFLAHWQERGDPIVSTIQRYIRMCRSLADLANESGRRCEDLGREVHATGVPTNAVTRHAEHYLGPDGGLSGDQRRAVEEYLRTCVTVYAAVLDGRDPDDVVASRRQETRRDPVASSVGAGPLHGSIAFSQDDDGAYAWGIAWSFDGSAGAQSEALGQCREYGGTRCAEAGWFQEACGALAIGDGNGYGTGWGATTGEAERDALAQCRVSNDDCRIEVARCSRSEEAGGSGQTDGVDTAARHDTAGTSDHSCDLWEATSNPTWNEEGLRRGGLNIPMEHRGGTRAEAEDYAQRTCSGYSNHSEYSLLLVSCDVGEAMCVQSEEAGSQGRTQGKVVTLEGFSSSSIFIGPGMRVGNTVVSAEAFTFEIPREKGGCASLVVSAIASCLEWHGTPDGSIGSENRQCAHHFKEEGMQKCGLTAEDGYELGVDY